MKEYLKWVQKTKAKGLNISMLISNEVPKSSGKKGSTSRRKGIPKGRKKEIFTEINGLADENCLGDASSDSSTNQQATSSFSTLPSTHLPPVTQASIYPPRYDEFASAQFPFPSHEYRTPSFQPSTMPSFSSPTISSINYPYFYPPPNYFDSTLPITSLSVGNGDENQHPVSD